MAPWELELQYIYIIIQKNCNFQKNDSLISKVLYIEKIYTKTLKYHLFQYLKPSKKQVFLYSKKR